MVSRVTWSGGHTPTDEDAVFQFNATPAEARTYTFRVRQTYDDGSIVDWIGAESSDTPAPRVQAQRRSAAAAARRQSRSSRSSPERWAWCSGCSRSSRAAATGR